MYVFLCPSSSAGSLIPPKLILAKFFFSDSAILLASVVLPTPGGPIKHMIGGCVLPLFSFTAIYSIILFFISVSP